MVLRHRIQSEGGAAAVEFAIVAVLLFMVVFAIIEFGRIFSTLEVLEGAAREGARLAAVRATSSEVEDAVRTAAGPYEGDISGLSIGGPCDDESSGDPVTVSFTYHAEINVGLLPSLNKDIPIQGVFRCE